MNKLLLFDTVDSYVVTHRLALALAAKACGFDVVVVTSVGAMGRQIRQAGLRVIHLDCRRSSVNPLSELRVIAQLVRIYRRERPDLVHHIALKPVLYGSIAARLVGVPAVINAITGTGHLFSADNLRLGLLTGVVRCALRFLLRGSFVAVQNADDAALVRGLGANRVSLIRGSGVDPAVFAPAEPPGPPPTVMLASRLLWEKGVGVFVDAARMLQQKGVDARFVLVGAPDPDNRGSVPEQLLKAWQADGVVEWWGHLDDMPAVLSRANMACLPSHYGEGVPKGLIEAASCGLPIVTTDMPGCREVVVDGENGFLVPPQDPPALADALEKLILDGALRRRMGAAGRARVIAGFSQQIVIDATMRLYHDAVRNGSGGVHD